MFRDIQERFWEKVDKRGPDECWPWKGASTRNGYGQIWLNGGLVRSNRLSYEFVNGAGSLEGLFACHSCDNPSCVNPAHIFPGTAKDNSLDMVKKGRAGAILHPDTLARGDRHSSKTHPERVPKGESHYKAKLTWEIVRRIRTMHQEGVEQRKIAKTYNLAPSTVCDVVNNRRWKEEVA